MAYAQEPQYLYQQPSYVSSQQANNTSYDYAPVDQAAGFDGVHRPGTPQQYSSAHDLQGGDPEHHRDTRQDLKRDGYGDNGYYGGIGHNGGGRSLVQQRPVEARRAHRDPQTPGQPRSISRPLERNRHPEGDLQYQANAYRDAQGHQQQHPADPYSNVGLSVQASSDNDYKNPTYSRQNGWQTDQQYTSPMDVYQQYHEPQQITGHHDQRYADGHGKGFQDNHAFAPVMPQITYQEPPRSSHGQPTSISSKSKTIQRSKDCKLAGSILGSSLLTTPVLSQKRNRPNTYIT